MSLFVDVKIYRELRSKAMTAILGQDVAYNDGDQKLNGLLVVPNHLSA